MAWRGSRSMRASATLGRIAWACSSSRWTGRAGEIVVAAHVVDVHAQPMRRAMHVVFLVRAVGDARLDVAGEQPELDHPGGQDLDGALVDAVDGVAGHGEADAFFLRAQHH